MNLAAAEGLPGSTQIDQLGVRETLDDWARAVAAFTASRVQYFEENPAAFDNSWARFCAHDLLMTLNVHLGVHYNMQQRTNPSLAKSEDQFIHGLVGGTGGTCASLPVVFVAVGRRLGYPLKLAQAKSHYYVRWDDPVTGEQFNIDGAGDGFAFHSDDHYKNWPNPIKPEELEHGNYLRSLSPREELSVFLTTRGDCLRENGRILDAINAYQQAIRVAPKNLFASTLLRQTRIHLQREIAEIEAPLRANENRLRSDPFLAVSGLPQVPSAHRVSVHRTVRTNFSTVRPHPVMNVGPVAFPANIANGNGAAPPFPGSNPSPRDLFEAMKRRNGVRTRSE